MVPTKGEEVLGSEQRRGKGFVGFVDSGGEGLGVGLAVFRVSVRVCGGLKLQEFPAELAKVWGEKPVWWGPRWEGLWEEVVVSMRL